MTKHKLAQQTIVLTGASGGIGTAFAKQLSDIGARLVLVARDSQKLEQLNQTLGGQHHCFACDINDETGRNLLTDYCERLSNGIDMLINNAGLSQFSAIETTKPEHIEAILSVNLTSTILLTQALLPLLKQSDKASIVNVGSSFGSIGYAGFAVYCASKFGLRGFTEALSRELSDSNINVRYFAPRATKTTINSQRVVSMNSTLGNKMDSPETVAKSFVKFLKNNKKRGFLGWPERLFIVVNNVFPNVVDNALEKKLAIIKQYF